MRTDAIPATAARLASAPGAVARLGLRANWRQFALLAAVNAFVGGMVGLERSILPVLAEQDFGVASKTVAISFIAAFGFAKALANLFAGRLSERFSRRSILIAGWLVGAPVPFIIIFAPAWGWIVAANVLLGVNQGFAWSMTVNMKVDLVGPRRRGFALGVNEAAGYLSMAAAAFAAGVIASRYGLRPEPWYLGIGFVACGLALSVLLVRDTAPFVEVESEGSGSVVCAASSIRESFARATWRDRHLVAISQAGFVNNLNDGLAWGIFPLFFASHGLSLGRIAILTAMYPLIWGGLQLVTGWASDVAGRKPLIVAGMLLQALSISIVGLSTEFAAWMAALAALGVGTAMVYPALLAATGDAVHPRERATALGVYRFWRDSGVIGAALAGGLLADAFGFRAAIQGVALLTAASGIVAALVLRSAPTASLRGEVSL
jgi:MFS family permease